MTPKAQETEEKIDKSNFKIRNFCAANDIEKVKRKLIE